MQSRNSGKRAESVDSLEKLDNNSSDKEPSDHIRINFHFSYFFDQRLNAIIVFFASMADLVEYQAIVSDSKEYSRTVYQYMKDNKVVIQNQWNISCNVELYLLPIVGEASQFEKMSDEIQEDEENTLGKALVHLDKDGKLLGGEVAYTLYPEKKNETKMNLSDAQKFMNNSNYFIHDDAIIVYFKNQRIVDEVLEHITDTLEIAIEFCRMMQVVQRLIKSQEHLRQLLQLKLMPSTATDDEFALELMNGVTKDAVDPLSKWLVVINKQGEISDGVLGRTVATEILANNNQVGAEAISVSKSENSSTNKFESNDNYYVYEWFIKETQEVFYVGMGFGDSVIRDKNDLFMSVKNKYLSDYRFMIQNVTRDAAVEMRDIVIKANLSAGYVLTNIDVPMGYTGARSSSALKTSYGARIFKYLETPEIAGNVVEDHYGLLDSNEFYDEVNLESLKKTVVPNYSIAGVTDLYFKDGYGNSENLLEDLKSEIQKLTGGKIYKSIAKSADSIIFANDPFPSRVKELHDKGYKVFHMVDVIKFLKIDLEQLVK